MFSLFFSEFKLLKNLSNSHQDHGESITPKERFALIFLLASGLVLGILFLIFIYIFATTYEFSEFNIEFQGIG